jgi:hypothetical protein
MLILIAVDLDLDVGIKHIHGILSKNSIPCFLRLYEKLSSIVEEKRKFVDEQCSPSLRRHSTKTAKLVRETIGDSNRLILAGKPVMSRGSLAIRVMDIRLSMFKEQFDPAQDCVQIKIGAIAVILSELFEFTAISQRELTLALSGHSVIRKCSKKEEKAASDIASWTIAQWNDHVASRSFKLILDLPPTEVRF